MKNKIFLIALLLTGLFVGCDDDEYEAPNSFSDVGWYTSLLRDVTLQVNIDNYVSFADLSQGTLEHSWTIEDGNFFLKGPFERKDSTTVYEKHIITPIKTESNDKTVHVLFKNSGLQKVRLYNTFKDSVTFKGKNGTTDVVFPSVKVGNKWVIDTTFVVDVFDTIVPQIQIKQNGVVVPHENPLDTIYIEAGDFLEFTDLTTIGRPNTSFWNIGGATSSAPVANILFKKLGAVKGIFASSRTGQNIPGAYEQYKIPVNFKVIPSSKPFVVFGDLKELENETIQIPFNGEFAPFFGQEQFFNVKVNGVNFPVASVAINAADATILDVKLVDKIYRPDVITISYAGGTLQSTDTRSPVAFNDLPVKMHNVNLMDAKGASFEDGGTAWVPMWDSKGTFEYSTEQASKGTHSGKLNADAGTVKIESKNIPFTFKAGKTYVITFELYFAPGSSFGSFSPWLLPNWKQFWTGGGGIAKGQWVTITKEYSATNDEPGRTWMFNTNGGSGTMYIDNWFIVEKEVRP